MTGGELPYERRGRKLCEGWRPPGWTHLLRGEAAADLDRWDAVLSVERSVGYELAAILTRLPVLSRLLGHVAPPGRSLEERESFIQQLRRRLVGRLFLRKAGMPTDLSRATSRVRPTGMPQIGPALDGEIAASLAFLGSVPFEELQARGWHLQPNHFYWPLNDIPFLRDNPQLWTRRRVPPGIDWDLEGQEALVRRLAGYAAELDDIRDGPAMRPGEFIWDNGSFPVADAHIYYGLVRELRPRHIVEVGAGWSSVLLGRAVAATGAQTEVTLIEPFPNFELLGDLPKTWHVLPQLVQHADPMIFQALGPGDVLFYDGSHCVCTGSDPNWMLFEVLPLLAPGVWIHFHDICWPWDYPPGWILDEGLSWNEQYLLQAFLMENRAYHVRLAANVLKALRGEFLKSLPAGFRREGTSVWIQKVA